MGVEHALVHDDTHEAFDLGKSFWKLGDGPQLPASLAEVREVVEWAWGRQSPRDVSAPSDLVMDRVARRIWHFIETHPGCRLANDCGDTVWDTKPFDTQDVEAFGADNLFHQVGSVYDEKGGDEP